MPSITIDINLSDYEHELESAGYVREDDLSDDYHRADDCPAEVGDAEGGADHVIPDTHRALLDWHDAEHGITDWVTCRQGPCAVIPAGFKDDRHNH